MKKLVLIINPIAGMGGRVGLKGTDGPHILKQARELGAEAQSPMRAVAALKKLLPYREEISIITCPGAMGEEESRPLGFDITLIDDAQAGKETRGEDTERAAAAMLKSGVDLLLFAGGDGTARNIHNAVGNRLTVLGIPAGVKIHSAVFALSPAHAGSLASLFLKDTDIEVTEAEVMDIDEEAFRQGRVSARLYGYMQVPADNRYLQNLKFGGQGGEEEALEAIGHDVAGRMEPGCLYLVGPGTTTRAVMNALELPNTLLGVDVVLDGKLVASDVNEKQLLTHLKGMRAKIIVTIIGGQGYIFGRGNQQFSPQVIKRVGREHIIVISPKSKLLSLGGRPLLVDTGDAAVNEMLSGYIQVITGERESSIIRVAY